ncbi:MAG: hypothetical protein IT385_19335 [Deltaproteobacteria bacterium]|nr:hypothetical protein [Deltaproteobacteria bacterium]
MKHLVASVIAVALGLGACASDESNTPHPNDRLGYPLSVTADPGAGLVWVVSGNFNLAYRSAAVLAIDVETNTFVPELAFETGAFPGELALLERGGRAVAAYITSRAEDRLYVATFGGDDPTRPEVSCPGGKTSGDILRCPGSKAIERTRVETADGEVELTLGSDPFGALVVPSRAPSEPDLLLTAAMNDGRLATFSLGEDGTPTLIGGADFVDGLYGLAQSPATGRVYGTSKLANVLSTFEIAPRFDASKPGQDALDPVNPWVTLAGSVTIPEPRANDRARAVAVSRDGTRLYIAYRAPDSLVIVDVADTLSGGQRARVLHKVALDTDPNDLVVVPDASGEGELVYVSCFGADRVEVVDPLTGRIVGGIYTGDGPSGLAYFANERMRRLYVALFEDDAVGIIELDPTSPYYHTEIGEVR